MTRPMPDPQDRIDIPGVAQPAVRGQSPAQGGRSWLSVWFTCCHTYARIYKNAAGSMYEGSCPRCRTRVRALVGPGGTSRRMFEAR